MGLTSGNPLSNPFLVKPTELNVPWWRVASYNYCVGKAIFLVSATTDSKLAWFLPNHLREMSSYSSASRKRIFVVVRFSFVVPKMGRQKQVLFHASNFRVKVVISTAWLWIVHTNSELPLHMKPPYALQLGKDSHRSLFFPWNPTMLLCLLEDLPILVQKRQGMHSKPFSEYQRAVHEVCYGKIGICLKREKSDIITA